MRLFKKLGLFIAAAILTVGAYLTVGFATSNNSHDTIENNVSKVASAQHIFDAKPSALQTPDYELFQEILDDEYIKTTVRKLSYSDLAVYVTVKLETEEYEIYSLGYYGTGAKNLPAYIELNVKDDQGNVICDENGTPIPYRGEIRRTIAAKEPYVLFSVYHQNEMNIEVNVEIPANTTVVENSVVIHNIFHNEEETLYKENEEGKLVLDKRINHVDLTHSYTKKCPMDRSLQVTNFSKFVDIKPVSVTKYFGYYAVQLAWDNKLTIEQYLELNQIHNPIFYTPPKDGKDPMTIPNYANLYNDVTYVNTQLVLTKNLSTLRVVDNDGVTHEVPCYPSAKNTTFGQNNIVLNFPAEGINGVKDFTIIRPMLTISVIKRETNKEEASSAFSYRFGSVGSNMSEVKGYVDGEYKTISNSIKPSYVDSDLICGILFVAITVVFAAVAIAQFIYRDKKYRNDEFKKLDKPQYIKISIYAYIWFVFAGLDIYYLICRTNGLNNAENFANPLDVVVIVFTLIAFLLGSYFIRRFYISTKETIEKNRREKLNLNNKTEEDSGTISSKFVKPQENTTEAVAETPTEEAVENK